MSQVLLNVLRDNINWAWSCPSTNTCRYSAPLKICETLKRLYRAIPKIVLLTNRSQPESNDRLLLTGLSKIKSAQASSTSKMTMMIKLKIPMRNSESLLIILLAVAVASPGTMRFSSTKKLEKIPVMNIMRYPKPATCATLRGDISKTCVISIPFHSITSFSFWTVTTNPSFCSQS